MRKGAHGHRLKPMLQAKACATLILLAGLVSGADKWIDYRMGPFHVISDAGDKAAREKLNQMEQMRYALGVELGKVGMGKDGLTTMWPIDILLFANQKEYLAHAPGKPFIDGGSATLSAWSGDTPLPREWLAALTRLLIDENSSRMPDSIETALCDLFSTIKVKETKVSLGAPLPEGELQGPRLRAWAKMQMLATLPDYSGKLRVYLNNIQQTGDEGVAVRNAFGMSAAELDLKLNAYVKAGKFEASTTGGEPLNPEHDFVEKPVEKAWVDGVFAELAAGGKNFPPDSPRGLVEKNTHASLELAIKANPKWAEPQFKLAQIETDKLAKMRELKAAATLDPRNAVYWQALAEAQAATDDYEGAAKSWALAEKAAKDEAERARIHIAKMALDGARADYTEAEKKRRAEEAARDLERVKAAAAAEVHAAEAAANARLNEGRGAYQKPQAWWDEPTGQKVEGKLTRVDCLNGPLRLTIQKEGGGIVKIAVRDLNKLTVNGASEAKFGCGVARAPRKIRLTYDAKPDAKLGTLGDVLVVEFP
ncbi:MAG TPA: hypothetical protein VK752_09195 [Bryobacteraceae bacterium]|jgi:hypothetical protein|nr:hypothetical protein [Bryobacteraceae bacterium]